MLVKISLILALCSHSSTDKVQAMMNQIQSQNPGATITLRLDKKAQCDAQGNIIAKKSKHLASK